MNGGSPLERAVHSPPSADNNAPLTPLFVIPLFLYAPPPSLPWGSSRCLELVLGARGRSKGHAAEWEVVAASCMDCGAKTHSCQADATPGERVMRGAAFDVYVFKNPSPARASMQDSPVTQKHK